MQFTWNIAQGVSSYNKQTGFGFVIGAVYNANAALRIPETNSLLPPMQYGQRTWNAAAGRWGSG